MIVLIILKTSLLLILLFICLLFFFFAILNSFIAAPFVPSSRKTVHKMIEAAQLQSNDIVFDLGSGDGRLIHKAARLHVKKAVGFELNPALNIYARIISKVFRLKNTVFLTKSLWSADLSKCDKLFIYLLPKTMSKLEEKIIAEMKSGSLVISHTFSFPNLEPIHSIENKVKVYRIK